MYLNRGSGLFELMAITFSVILSTVRSLRGGMSTFEGSIMSENSVGQLVLAVYVGLIEATVVSTSSDSSRLIKTTRQQGEKSQE